MNKIETVAYVADDGVYYSLAEVQHPPDYQVAARKMHEACVGRWGFIVIVGSRHAKWNSDLTDADRNGHIAPRLDEPLDP